MASEAISNLLLVVVSVQFMLLWSIGSSQKPGFTSIDCGSSYPSTYTDSDGIVWISDSNLTSEGTPVRLSDNGLNQVLTSMRVFNGTQSKYCYSFTNSMNSYILPKAFFLVRASIMPGTNPPYKPRNSDGMFRFKMIVDGDEWQDVQIPYGDTTWWTFDIYMRAQRDSIDVCFARDGRDGDAPFVSGLELRPLPDTLTTTLLMNGTGRIFICMGHNDYGVSSSGPSHVRYPDDALDRYWISYTTSDSNLNSTEETVNTLTVIDQPPEKILQTAYTGGPSFTLNWSGLEVGSKHYVQFYFAEINPLVTASGMRVFNIFANGENLTTPVDVFDQVGANTAFSVPGVVDPDESGSVLFNFAPVANSTFPPFLAAAELFNTRVSNTLTSSAIVDVVEATKNILGLSNYRGDPCLPAGYGYNWLNCSEDNSGITAILLSNYQTGGKIPTQLSQLPMLTDIYLDGNSLQGEIPDLSSLERLSILNLSNNKLTGSIPNSLTTLKNLKALYLENNNLSGEIPDALLQQKKSSLLTFEFSGNPGLCESSECAASTSSSPQSLSPDSNSKKSNTGLIVGIIMGCFVLVLSIVATAICLLCYCRRRKSNLQNRSTDANQVSPADGGHSQVQEVMPVVQRVIPCGQVQQFSSEEIKAVTNNFFMMLGEGGFGSVYRGSLEDKRLVAVKVSSRSSHQGLKEFMNEVNLLSRVHHRNLVDLVGYSNEDKLVLVYEFMSKGSLFECLHGPLSKSSPLPWATRLTIMVDAAQGLHYLHEGCNPEIIHRDIKSSNILMNDKMEAKLADFGISRNKLMTEDEGPPTMVMGSKGYVDPEYISSLKITEKIDVYSFGVVLFEVVSGRRSTFYISPTRQETSIVDWAKSSILHGVIDDIVDPSLGEHYDIDSVWKVLEVALACVDMPSFKRPRMNQVCQALKEAFELQNRSNTMDVNPPLTGYTTEMSSSFFENVDVR